MGRVYDTTDYVDTQVMRKSKLTKNFFSDNYWIESFQNKVDAAWRLSPDVVDIQEQIEEYTDDGYRKAKPKYQDLEVRITSAYDEKGQKLTDDYKDIIYKDVQHPQLLGCKYFFDLNDFTQKDPTKKCTWLNINFDTVKLGANALIRRCTQNLGFLINDNTQEWYEPCIIDYDAKYTINYFSEVIQTVKSEIYITLQFNEYTKNIQVNDRFIVGALDFEEKDNNAVYKVKEVFRFGALYTDNPNSIPLIILAMDRDLINTETDLISRDDDGTMHYIADYYIKHKDDDNNKIPAPDSSDEVLNGGYYLKIFSDDRVVHEGEYLDLSCFVYTNNDEKVDAPVDFVLSLSGPANPTLYYSYEKIDDNTIRIYNLKRYFRNDLEISCGTDSKYNVENLIIFVQLGEKL